MTKLLVSVRSAEEALAAEAGGADLIDVKEPSAGPLGAANAATIAEIVGAVGLRRPISAAGGEAIDCARGSIPSGIAFIKFGFSQTASFSRRELSDLLGALDKRIADSGARLVVAAYADAEAAVAPPPEALLDAAIAHHAAGFLIDTWRKDGRCLWDHVAASEAAALASRARDAGLLAVLAGSLREHDLETACECGADYAAVRGAACRDDRNSEVQADKVRRLQVRLCAVQQRCATSDK